MPDPRDYNNLPGWTPQGPNLQAGSASFVPVVQAATTASGFALANSTGTICSWAVPNDGKQHFALAVISMNITSTATGGAIVWTFSNPANVSQTPSLVAASQAAGTKHATDTAIVMAGTTVSITQNTAMTAGAAVVWAAIIGI